MSARAQCLALWLAMARTIADSRAILVDVSPHVRSDLATVKMSVSLPFVLPGDADLAAFTSATKAAQPPALLGDPSFRGSGSLVPSHDEELDIPGLDGEALGLHVLLVDDQEVIRRVGAKFLRQLGCTVELLDDGDQVEAALLQPRSLPIDAIVLDIVMRRSDGAEICRVLREKLDVQLPIIAVTAYAGSKAASAFFTHFDVVLAKPFSREALGRALLEGKARRTALRRGHRRRVTPPELQSGAVSGDA
jgi:hypothetical protein